MKIENEFIPYDQALVLKELGFDKECFGYYHYKKYYQYGLDFENIIFKYKCKLIDKGFNLYPNDKTKRDIYILEKDKSNFFCKAPLYQQAFRWLWNKTGKYIIPIQKDDKEWLAIGIVYKTYEEAELECLKKLIKIVKNK